MKISDILTSGRTCARAPGVSKKRVLDYLSAYIAERDSDVDTKQLYSQLFARERLGSTGIGNGFAIPHCRLKGCDHITAAFFRLDNKVDFDAIDNEPVDLVFALIVPEDQDDEHLQILAGIARIFQNPDTLKKLRNCKEDQTLYDTLIESEALEGD